MDIADDTTDRSDYESAAGSSSPQSSSSSERAGDLDAPSYADEGATGGADSSAEGAERDGSTSQTWQESEAAQRQPIVDVGGGNRLTLYSQRVITRVEGHRARTIVDQVFYSPYDRELEGTFRYSLPVGASVSHYALYLGRITGELDALGDRAAREEPLAQTPSRELLGLEADEVVERVGEDAEAWGELRVGRVVSQADGREAYEDTTRANVDPALVESVAPNSFQARVFPIQPRGYTRVVFAYEEDLARIDDELVYTFPLPEDELAHLSFQLQVVEGAEQPQADPEAEPAGQPEVESTLPLTPIPARALPDESGGESGGESTDAWKGSAEGRGPGGAVTLRLPASRGVELITGQDEETQAFAGRLTLEGISELASSSSIGVGAHARAIFVLDTSLSSQPTRFGINRALLAQILEESPEIEEFAVLTFDLGAEWITEGFISNGAAQRAEVLSEIDRISLEGATRFDAVTDAINAARWIEGEVDLFLLSDGAINWGTIDPAQVSLKLSRVDRVFAYRTGIGAENEPLYQALTTRGAVFSCLTPESVARCARAHASPRLRLLSLEVVGVGSEPAETRELIYSNRGGEVFDGAELKFAGELTRAGSAELIVTLVNDSGTHEQRFPITLETPTGQLAPRAWAELLVSALSESAQPRLNDLIYALSQRYTILTREVVLLVLETDEEYAEYDLMSAWEEILSEVDSVIEALEQASASGALFAPLLEQTLIGISPQIEDATGASLESILEELGFDLYDLTLPEVSYEHRAVRDARYDDGVDLHDPSQYGVFMDEAESRFMDGLTHAAARALSSIVETSPSDAVSLRLVAYRLYTWGMSGLAAELFAEVLRRRPYEPQSYRDLAYIVRASRPQLSMLLYEIATRGDWDARFRQLNTLIGEEYNLLVSALERQMHPLSELATSRRAALDLPSPRGDLRVILSWNTDNVDIDLWVTDPSGEKCYYANTHTASGGELLDDVTQGFGPERFAEEQALRGTYTVEAHYYANNGNRLVAETFVHVTVIKYAGTPEEEIIESDALLSEVDSVVTMAQVSF